MKFLYPEQKFVYNKTMKKEKLKKIINIAKSVSELSKDEQTKVGALLLSENDLAIVAVGYNGFIRNAPDDLLPKTRPDKYKYTIHAELNLIINCARHGISTDNKILVCTHSPCQNCFRHIANSGIKKIYFEKWYKNIEELVDIDLKFDVVELDNDLFEITIK